MNFDVFSTKFAYDIYLQKYSLNKQEKWKDTCYRVVNSVCSQYLDVATRNKILDLMLERKFIPGGRYLCNSGRELHQVNNCFLFRAHDSRLGWSNIMNDITMSLMTGGGIGVDYSRLREEGAPIIKTGGTSTGPIALMNMVNEAGRYIMQGGQRRSAIWAGLNWKHPDIFKFLDLKNWPEELKKLKEKNLLFQLPMEGTNISVIYDTEFFVAIEHKDHPNHSLAKKVWLKNCKQAFSTAEPGMSMNFLKDNESLRNAPVSGNTKVLTKNGYKKILDIVNIPTQVWTGKQWADDVIFKKTMENVQLIKVLITGNKIIECEPNHEFIIEKWSGKGKKYRKCEYKRIKAKDLKENDYVHVSLPETQSTKFSRKGYTLGYTYGDGSFHPTGPYGQITFCTNESKKCADFVETSWLTKSGIREDKRGYLICSLKSNEILRDRFKNVFPDDMYEKDENFISSFIAGLFDADGNYVKDRQLLRLSNNHKDFLLGVSRLLGQLGINSGVYKGSKGNYPGSSKNSWCLLVYSDSIKTFKNLIPTIRINIEANNYIPYRKTNLKVEKVEFLEKFEDVYCCDVKVPEHSFMAEGIIISNCTEVVSEDDSDKCNLGTLWINRFENKEEFGEAVKYATLFLLCGGLYSDVPTDKIQEVGIKNNRIGLGLGGLHEWLIVRGCEYEVTPELHKWLNIYEQESDSAAYIGAKQLNVSIPKGKRAIAPTGTIGILAETTTGIEPLFCKAYKRRYLNSDKKWAYQYVVDGAVKRLLDSGISLENIKDTYDIDFKSRVKFQADVQNYVDMSISSTCNLPSWGSEENNEESLKKNSKILLKYAKRLRGFTCYPDGARGGQPLNRVNLELALSKEGLVFEENEHECIGGVCGV